MISTTKPVAIGDKVPVRTMTVAVRARDCREAKPGIWDIQIEARELTEKESDLLAELFPHSANAIDALLDKEALIGALVKRSDRF